MEKALHGIKCDFVPTMEQLLHAAKLVDPQGAAVLRLEHRHGSATMTF